MTSIKPVSHLPSAGEKNGVSKILTEAVEAGFEEIFIIGVRDGNMQTLISGYKGLDQKLGLLELLKHNMIIETTM